MTLCKKIFYFALIKLINALIKLINYTNHYNNLKKMKSINNKVFFLIQIYV